MRISASIQLNVDLQQLSRNADIPLEPKDARNWLKDDIKALMEQLCEEALYQKAVSVGGVTITRRGQA